MAATASPTRPVTSASTKIPAAHESGRSLPGAVRRTGLTTLVRVELRKLVDTRAGFWLHILIVLASSAAMVAVLAGPEELHAGTHIYSMGAIVAALLLPISGILALTTEWSNGSVMTTFALVPHRHRIIVAKTIALVISAVVVTALLLGIAWLLTAAISGEAGGSAWDVDAEHVGTSLLGILGSMLMGVAFGAVFMSPAVAIVTYLVLPVVWTLMGATVEYLADAAQWLDTSATFTPLLDGTIETSRQWQQVGVSALVWIAAPLTIGLVRLARREIR